MAYSFLLQTTSFILLAVGGVSCQNATSWGYLPSQTYARNENECYINDLSNLLLKFQLNFLPSISKYLASP